MNFVSFNTMTFDTRESPQCGLCQEHQADAHYKRGVLQEDVICNECKTKWTYDADLDGYVRNESIPDITATCVDLNAIRLRVFQDLIDRNFPHYTCSFWHEEQQMVCFADTRKATKSMMQLFSRQGVEWKTFERVRCFLGNAYLVKFHSGAHPRERTGQSQYRPDVIGMAFGVRAARFCYLEWFKLTKRELADTTLPVHDYTDDLTVCMFGSF